MTNRELRHENVPAEVVPVLARQLEALGARVAFEAELAGVCHHPSGTMRFTHVADVLLIEVLDHKGHFPDKMVIGGIRQMIEEAVEMVKGSGGRSESLDVETHLIRQIREAGVIFWCGKQQLTSRRVAGRPDEGTTQLEAWKRAGRRVCRSCERAILSQQHAGGRPESLEVQTAGRVANKGAS